MNISELLSDFLKQGKSVDIPGIGSLSAKHVKAHYDADSATFFPSQQLVDFSPLMKGGNEFVHFLSQKDCVSDAIGERTWNNYVEAMKRQLEIDGMLELKGLGTVRKGENGLEFTAAEGLNDGNPLMKAVKNVKQYTAAVNPFARFEHLPEPEPQPIVEEEPPVEDTPVVVEESAPVEEQPEPVQEETPAEEIPVEETPVEEVPVEEVPVEEAPVETEETPDETPSPETDAPHPFDQYIGNDTPAEPEQPAAETEPEPEPEVEQTSDEPLDGLKALEELQQTAPVETTEQPRRKEKKEKKCKEGKKKCHGWIWILLLILALLAGAGVYLWKSGQLDTLMSRFNSNKEQSNIDIEQMVTNSEGSETSATAVVDDPESGEVYGDNTDQETPTEEESTETPETEPSATTSQQNNTTQASDLSPYTNVFTFSTDGLEFTDGEVGSNVDEVMAFMDSYITNFALSRRYSTAVDQLKEQVRQYVSDEMNHSLKGEEGFLVQNLLPNEDFVRKHNMEALKNRKANRSRCMVQTKLMDNKLAEILEQVVADNDLQQDAVRVAAPRPATPVSTASYSSRSKKGYDCIAGFFVTKAYADRMATNLKKKGCDAYVIEVNQGYYVSMGSAESRTKAEAMYAHIKEWYKGDLTIKKF